MNETNDNGGRDTPLAVNFVDIPEELKRSCTFCLWKKEKRKGGITKVPYDPVTRSMARTNEPGTFSDFGTVIKAYVPGGYDGIGIRVAEGIGAIDIDHCIRPDGSLNDVAASIMSVFKDTYFERSPSGTGLRGFFKVDPDFVFDKTVYYINNRKLGLEIYLPGATNRFVTVTGNMYRPGSVTLDMNALETVLNTFMKRSQPLRTTASNIDHVSYLSDESVIRHATRAKDADGNPTASAQKFKDYLAGDWQKYYDNQSDADMSFISMLAFWCGCNEEQMDRIYRSSGMMRDKWDRKQAGTTYGAITIRNAVAGCREVYTPIHVAADEEFDEIDGDTGSADSTGSDETTSAGPDNQASSTDGYDDRALKDHALKDHGPKSKKKKDEKPAFRPDLSRVKRSLDEMKPQSSKRYGSGEIGIGNLFADYYKPIARFHANRGLWYIYDGKVWRPDEGDLAVNELAKGLADALYMYALKIPEENTRDDYIKRVRPLQKRKNRKTMIEDAKSVYPVTMEWFDQDPYLFNCQNGTLNLRTLEFRPHDPEDYLTMISKVVYDPEADCPRWHSFISEVMCGDKETASYLQKALGYALTGVSNLECLFILYGPTTRNGKGTMMETFLKIMGDYGKTSNPEMLTTKFNANSSGPSEEIARLAGVRFVNISEPERRITFNAALVKRMTGNDTLNARFLHENSFDFKPCFKIFINTNYKPNVSDMTLFESHRLLIIPFKRHFEDDEQDTNLKTLFSEPGNQSGIFNWCLEGYKRFREEGLIPPKAVVAATEEYKEDSDKIGQFIEAWLDVGKDEDGHPYEVRSSAVYRVYCNWSEKYGYRAENSKNFNAAITSRFELSRKRPRDGGEKTSMLIGVRLREMEAGAEEEEHPALTNSNEYKSGYKNGYKRGNCGSSAQSEFSVLKES